MIKRKDERNYKLKGQSAVVGLNAVLGTRQTFTLNDPLKIRKGEFLALTLPTWVPNFAVGLSRPDEHLAGQPRGADERAREDRRHQGRQAAAEGRLDPQYGCDYRRPDSLLGLLPRTNS